MTILNLSGARVAMFAVVGLLLAACSSTSTMPMSRHLGFRPDEPLPQTTGNPPTVTDTCKEYFAQVKYAEELQEAYHSRATQNRWWIYVAGIVGLGVIAATGGLAAAGGVSLGTLAVLNISGGFAAGTFATLDNPTLAEIYTISANKVDEGKAEASKLLTDQSCRAALDKLNEKVSAARTDLELARTDSAKAAVMRAAAQQESLRKQAEALNMGSLDVSSPSKTQLAPGDRVWVRVSGGRLEYNVTVTPADSGLTATRPTKDTGYVSFIEPAKVANEYKDGEFLVTYRDREGSSRTLTFTVKAGPVLSGALEVKALTSTKLPPQENATAAFSVTGGKPPYQSLGPETADDPITVSPAAGEAISGAPATVTIKLTSKAEGGKTYKAKVKDSESTTKEIVVTTVPVLGLKCGPSDGGISIKAGDSVTCTVSGGQPEYKFKSAPKSLDFYSKLEGKGTYVATGFAEPGAYTITVSDALGQQATYGVAVEKKPDPAPVKPPQPAILTKEVVAKAQVILKFDKHIDPIEIDGIAGPHTRAAVKRFQESQGLPATGDLDEKTLKALGLG